MKHSLLLLLFLLSSSFSFAKSSMIDSLSAKVETVDGEEKVETLSRLAWEYRGSNRDTALAIIGRALQLAEEIQYDAGIARGHNVHGVIYEEMRQHAKAIASYKSSIEVSERSGNKKMKATTLNNLGIVYLNQQNYEAAQQYFLESAKIRSELNDDYGSSQSYNNLGLIYQYMDDYAKAKEYYNISLALDKKIQNLGGAANVYLNLASIYQNEQKFDSSLACNDSAIKYANIVQYEPFLAGAYFSKGRAYSAQNNFKKALEYYLLSLPYDQKFGDSAGIALTLNNIGVAYKNSGNLNKATDYSNQSLEIAEAQLHFENLKLAHWNLSETYEKKGDIKKAFSHHKAYHNYGDSLLNRLKQEQARDLMGKYESEKKEKEIAILQKNQALDAQKLAEQELSIEAQKNESYLLYGGIGIVAVISGFLFVGFDQKKKANIVLQASNDEISRQKEIVEEKNQEITDSITYARRIQAAILPPDKLVKEYLENSFILYKPKDIVAGDFYWMEQVGDTILFAAADCTGHGVPGAMVSVVCHNAMNRAVREFGLREPGKILDKTREIVSSEFEKSEEEVKDGMDIALCSLTGSTLLYAGAHNPLWIIRSSRASELHSDAKPESLKAEANVIEIKADKQPIGNYIAPTPFTTRKFELEKGDTFYIFSDGFVDQFGGDRGKKLKARAFRELLISIQDKEISEHGAILDKAFEDWRGQLDQIDDVCVIGVRL